MFPDPVYLVVCEKLTQGPQVPGSHAWIWYREVTARALPISRAADGETAKAAKAMLKSDGRISACRYPGI
jgi:hypothetical protein